MLYLAHFDFSTDEPNDGEHHGYFTCVVGAENIEESLGKFKDLLFILKEKEDVLNGIEEVFLNSCIEIKEIPEAGFLASYVSYVGASAGSISTSIRGANNEQCIAYGFGMDEEGEGETIPFLSFVEK